MPEYDLKFKDFSIGDPEAPGNELGLGVPVQFKVGKDVFSAPPVIAPILAGDLIDAATGISAEDLAGGAKIKSMVEKIANVFDLLLTEESAPRFRERLTSTKEPIDLNRQAVPIMMWLLEVYGLRPTEPSSDSPDGLNDGGTTSTDTAPTGE